MGVSSEDGYVYVSVAPAERSTECKNQYVVPIESDFHEMP